MKVINLNIINKSSTNQDEIKNGLEVIKHTFPNTKIYNYDTKYQAPNNIPGLAFLNKKNCTNYKIENNTQNIDKLIINVNCAGASLFNIQDANDAINKRNIEINKNNEENSNNLDYDNRQNPPPPSVPTIKSVNQEERVNNNINFLVDNLVTLINANLSKTIHINLLVCKSSEFADKVKTAIEKEVKKEVNVNGYNFVYDVDGKYFINYPETLKEHYNTNGCFSKRTIERLELSNYKIDLSGQETNLTKQQCFAK